MHVVAGTPAMTFAIEALNVEKRYGALHEEGRRHLADGAATVDLKEVTELDSSALALLLAWLREAKAAGRAVAFANLPESLQTIARLYGVQDLLPAAR